MLTSILVICFLPSDSENSRKKTVGMKKQKKGGGRERRKNLKLCSVIYANVTFTHFISFYFL